MICVENSQDVDPTPLHDLMERVGDGRVCVCLDIGHANYSDAPMTRWFDRLGGKIAYLHLSDNMGKFDDHLPLGDGIVNWKLTDALWRQLNREMPITLEVGGTKGVERSLAYLKGNGFFGVEE
jgi:sugar phosphate isomerase/epimerase